MGSISLELVPGRPLWVVGPLPSLGHVVEYLSAGDIDFHWRAAGSDDSDGVLVIGGVDDQELFAEMLISWAHTRAHPHLRIEKGQNRIVLTNMLD